MSNLRLKGKNVKVSIKNDGAETDLAEYVKSLDVDFLVETSSEGYLGRLAELTEEDFSGADLDMSIHMGVVDYFDILEEVIRRSSGNTGGALIDVSATFDFSETVSRTVQFPDVKFNRPRLSATSNKDFVSGTLRMHSDEVNFTS